MFFHWYSWIWNWDVLLFIVFISCDIHFNSTGRGYGWYFELHVLYRMILRFDTNFFNS